MAGIQILPPINYIGQENQQQTFGQGLGSGLMEGLQRLSHQKMREVERKKESELFRRAGYTPEAADLLVHLKESGVSPEFGKLLGGLGGGAVQEGQQGVFGGSGGSGGASDIGQQKLQQARELADEKKTEPFLKGLAEDYRNAQVLRSKAKGMLDNLEKNEKKFPGQTAGYIARKTGAEELYKDPDVAKYIADSTSLVTALANSRKGQPTNFKIKFEQLSKPQLSQPLETQKALLKDIIKNADSVFKTNKFVSSQKEANQGRIPGDIRERLISAGLEDLEIGEGAQQPQESQQQFQAGQELDELPDASSVPSGTEVEYGKDILVSDGTSWKKKR